MIKMSRRFFSIALPLAISALASLRSEAQSARRVVKRRPGRKNVLAWIDSRSGMHSHAAATIERLGYDSGLWDTYIRSDTQAAMGPHGGGWPVVSDLEEFDAIFFLGSREAREEDLTEQQRATLLSFVKDGKGFVAGHAATDAYRSWTGFGEMVGGRLSGQLPWDHPWGVTDTTLVIEDPNFPGQEKLPRLLATHDETYVIGDVSRQQVHVLIRLDATHLDMTKPNRKDGDYPMAWAKMYGKGRVYSNSLGHDVAGWDNPAFQKMYLEAMKWALGFIDAIIAPHPLVQVNGTPKPLK